MQYRKKIAGILRGYLFLTISFCHFQFFRILLFLSMTLRISLLDSITLKNFHVNIEFCKNRYKVQTRENICLKTNIIIDIFIFAICLYFIFISQQLTTNYEYSSSVSQINPCNTKLEGANLLLSALSQSLTLRISLEKLRT